MDSYYNYCQYSYYNSYNYCNIYNYYNNYNYYNTIGVLNLNDSDIEDTANLEVIPYKYYVSLPSAHVLRPHVSVAQRQSSRLQICGTLVQFQPGTFCFFFPFCASLERKQVVIVVVLSILYQCMHITGIVITRSKYSMSLVSNKLRYYSL